MLTLILGVSGTGKSAQLMQHIRQRAQAGQFSVLIVPEQFTSTTEGRIYRQLGDALSGYVESCSFSSLAETLLRRYGGAAVPTLTDAGRAVLIRRAMEQLGEQINVYRRQRRSAAFCQLAAETVSELKSAGVSPANLARLSQEAGRGRDKLSELALIYETYETLLQGTAMDPGDRVALAAQKLQPDFFTGKAVFIDEFDTFNYSKRQLLRGILPLADVTVALCCDQYRDLDGGMGLFSGAKAVARTLVRMAGEAGVPNQIEVLTQDRRHDDAPGLAALNTLLVTEDCRADAAPEVTLFAADSRQKEAAAVAASILKKARQGVPFSKMAVICRTAESYLSPLRYQFRLAGIPLFCDEPNTPENTAPALAVRAALGLLRGGLSSQNLLRLVKTGLCALTEEQQCALENYAYTWPLRATEWREPFVNSPEGFASGEMDENARHQLQLAEEARAFLAPRADAFLQKARGLTAAALSRRIYLFLCEIGGEEQTQALSEALQAEGRLPEAAEAVREWNLTAELLNQMAQLLGEDKLEPLEYDELFALLLRATDLGHIPQTLDSVIFTTAGRMRLGEVDVCYVLGLAEGEFPQTPGDVGLLTHEDRDVMIRSGIEMPDCFENRLIREQICFYKALTAARRQLWLSWPGGSMGLPLSAAIEPVRAKLNLQPPTLSVADCAATPALALDTLGGLWQQNDATAAALYAALQSVPQADRWLLAVRHLAGHRQFQTGDIAALKKLLGPGLYLSPSRVERFYTCNFAYFMEYVLRIKPRQKAQLSPNQSGSLVHWVLENALSRSGDTFATLEPTVLDALANSLVDEYVAENMPQAGVRFAYLISRLKANVKELLRYLQQDVRQSAFVPAAFEQKIGEGPGEVPPVTLQTPDGEQIRVVGTIDRVDTLQRDGKTYIRVIDYKTGNKKFALEEVYCGLDCQMLLYLFTLARNGGERYPNPAAAGVLYLLADPAPKTLPRSGESGGKVYELDGLVLNDEAVVHAMDPNATGLFVPFGFDKKGKPAYAAKKLAGLEKLGRIQKHIDHLVVEMARRLYAGDIAGTPLCAGAKHPCDYCDYRCVCRHEDGVNERVAAAPKNVFETDLDYEEHSTEEEQP